MGARSATARTAGLRRVIGTRTGHQSTTGTALNAGFEEVAGPASIRLHVGAASGPSLASATRRSRSPHEWVVANRHAVERHRGRWIAVTPDGIVASSLDFDEVYELAERKGVRNPFVFKVPEPETLPRAVRARSR